METNHTFLSLNKVAFSRSASNFRSWIKQSKYHPKKIKRAWDTLIQITAKRSIKQRRNWANLTKTCPWSETPGSSRTATSETKSSRRRRRRSSSLRATPIRTCWSTTCLRLRARTADAVTWLPSCSSRWRWRSPRCWPMASRCTLPTASRSEHLNQLIRNPKRHQKAMSAFWRSTSQGSWWSSKSSRSKPKELRKQLKRPCTRRWQLRDNSGRKQRGPKKKSACLPTRGNGQLKESWKLSKNSTEQPPSASREIRK